jgi:hypothetical protein
MARDYTALGPAPGSAAGSYRAPGGMTPEQTLALEKILLPHGGRGLDAVAHPNFTDNRVIEYLRLRGRVFDKTGLVIHRLANRNCHWNVSDLILWPNYRVAHGFVLATDGFWYAHSWGVQDDHIVETCPADGKGRMKYFGFEFPNGVNVNATHGGLGDELERGGFLAPDGAGPKL